MAKQQFEDMIREGMAVVSADGEKLGKITRVHADGFEIEKGIVFREECQARFGDVLDLRGKDVFLGCSRAELERRAAAEPARAATSRAPGPGEETRIPLAEEEVIAHKQAREAGEVIVRKETVTEEKQVTVPVQREVVRVERVPASGEPARGEAFKAETVTVPVRTEEVELEKRPVVREEVVISKETRQGTETAGTTVRKEQLDVESSGDLKEREVPTSGQPPLKKAG